METYMVMDMLNFMSLNTNAYILVIQNSLLKIAVLWKTVKLSIFKEREDFFQYRFHSGAISFQRGWGVSFAEGHFKNEILLLAM